MREILFRGKAINRDNGNHRTDYKNGDWVYGLVTKLYDERFENLPAEMTDINGVSGIEVDYKTIGEFTGLTDKNGKRIFEGDIFKPFDDEICYVAWIEYFSTLGLMVHSTWRERKRGKEISHFSKGWTYLTEYSLNELEIIGNIHDNPELIKGGVDNA